MSSPTPVGQRPNDDAEVLWAGGIAWNLRASINRPVPAGLDLDSPHLCSAPVMPSADVPTPLWDAFVAAVWPDPGERISALRVLSSALTGYPAGMAPVLYGPTGRGKTSVVTLLLSLLGSYAHAADPWLLDQEQACLASCISTLQGRRLAVIDACPGAGRWAHDRLRQLTDGRELTGTRIREAPVTFAPTHTLVLIATDEPGRWACVRSISCLGRAAVVGTTRAALGNHNDPAAAWWAEAPGVLAALMREAAAWLAERDDKTDDGDR